MVHPEDEEEEEDEEFEPLDGPVEEFETVEEKAEPESVEEFEGFDENAPDDIPSSGFKTKAGEIPDYEPTVDEVLSYAMGKTSDPSQPAAPRTMEVEMDDGDDLPEGIGEALDEVIEELGSADDEAEEDHGIEGLDEAFDEEDEEERD